MENKTDLSFESRLEAAQAAMAGPERLAKREENNRREQAYAEKTKIKERLGQIIKEKETLELNWIRFDDQRQNLHLSLKPLLEEEKKLEEEEARTEIEEARAADHTIKQMAEEKRWLTQNKRHDTEEKKWRLEKELKEIEEKIELDTKKYQALLDEEDDLKQKLVELTKVAGL